MRLAGLAPLLFLTGTLWTPAHLALEGHPAESHPHDHEDGEDHSSHSASDHTTDAARWQSPESFAVDPVPLGCADAVEPQPTGDRAASDPLRPAFTAPTSASSCRAPPAA